MNRKVSCPICFEDFGINQRKIPRFLKECGHTLCSECILRMLAKGPKVPCPTCRVETSGKYLSDHPKNFALLELLSGSDSSYMQFEPSTQEQQEEDDEFLKPEEIRKQAEESKFRKQQELEIEEIRALERNRNRVMEMMMSAQDVLENGRREAEEETAVLGEEIRMLEQVEKEQSRKQSHIEMKLVMMKKKAEDVREQLNDLEVRRRLKQTEIKQVQEEVDRKAMTALHLDITRMKAERSNSTNGNEMILIKQQEAQMKREEEEKVLLLNELCARMAQTKKKLAIIMIEKEATINKKKFLQDTAEFKKKIENNGIEEEERRTKREQNLRKKEDEFFFSRYGFENVQMQKENAERKRLEEWRQREQMEKRIILRRLMSKRKNESIQKKGQRLSKELKRLNAELGKLQKEMKEEEERIYTFAAEQMKKMEAHEKRK